MRFCLVPCGWIEASGHGFVFGCVRVCAAASPWLQDRSQQQQETQRGREGAGERKGRRGRDARQHMGIKQKVVHVTALFRVAYVTGVVECTELKHVIYEV